MGTRGTLGFVIDGEEKLAYNHFDSYPDGVGVDVLKWASEVTNWETIGKLARDLKLVTTDDPEPTQEQIEQLIKYHNESVSTGYPTEWYSLLRHTQGDPRAILEAGYMEDARGFPLDSLFCEWGYVVDLDNETLEVYRGFQKEAHHEGRFADRLELRATHHCNPDVCFRCGAKKGTAELEAPCPKGYYAIRLLKAYPLTALPDNETFVKELNTAAYGEEEVA